MLVSRPAILTLDLKVFRATAKRDWGLRKLTKPCFGSFDAVSRIRIRSSGFFAPSMGNAKAGVDARMAPQMRLVAILCSSSVSLPG